MMHVNHTHLDVATNGAVAIAGSRPSCHALIAS